MDRSDLYAVPLDEFTAQRNALAKELRGDGRRDEAAEVAKLRKPSAAAWAVNQLVRQAKREMRALFKAGDALQQAQADLLSGKGEAEALRPAVDAERQAVDTLADRAEELLPGGGAGSRRQQIADTLHAAALDEDARALVAAGCLDRELQHVGLGGFGGLDAAPPARRRPERRDAGRKRMDAERKPKDAERERKAAEAARAARQAQADARRAADRARRHLEVVQKRRDGLADQLAGIEDELTAAKRAATDAEKALQRLSG